MSTNYLKRLVAVFFIFFCFFVMPLLAEKTGVLKGAEFTGDLTVPQGVLPFGEPLSLDEATRLALAQNLDIQIAEADRHIQSFNATIAEGIYDAKLGVEGTYSHDKQERTSLVLGSRELEGQISTSLEKKIPLGTDVKFELGTRRSSTASAFSTLSRNYSSFGTLSVKHPFLKNFFGYVDRKRIQQIRLDTKKFHYQKIDEIESSLLEIRRSYFELAFAQENLVARRDALRMAQDFLSITKDQSELGLFEKPDIYAAEANVRRRVLEVWKALTDLKTASNEVKVLLDRPEIDLIQANEMLNFIPMIIDIDEEMRVAMETRRDLLQAQLNVESQEVGRKIAKNSLLPNLDFEGSVSSTSLDRDMANSQGEIASFNHPQYYAAVRFSSPIERRKERGEYSQALYSVDQAKKQMRLAKMTLQKDMDNSYRELQLTERQVLQTKEINNLQQMKLDEEQKNFNRGRSDSKTIIDYQEDVIDARINAIRALVDYRIATDQFYRTQNTLLERAGVAASGKS